MRKSYFDFKKTIFILIYWQSPAKNPLANPALAMQSINKVSGVYALFVVDCYEATTILNKFL